ncbi:MAG: hypothetical protein AB7G47_10200 [Mycolicibacterium sp.]|uniref:hypothetical protein n=1 Tax=Mycolicibacterium sp. TaxID=2320850 RepID=UPI003D10BCE0
MSTQPIIDPWARGDHDPTMPDRGSLTGGAGHVASGPGRVEIIIVRPADGATEIYLYVDGVESSDYAEYVVEAAAGYIAEDWAESRDEALAAASPAVAEHLRASTTIRRVLPTSWAGGNLRADR